MVPEALCLTLEENVLRMDQENAQLVRQQMCQLKLCSTISAMLP